MPVSLDDVQSRIASISDQDQNTANISSTDYSLRRTYINMAEKEWSENYDWRSLYREYNVRVSTSTGNASIALPEAFRKLGGFPKITYDGSTTEDFPEIRPEEKQQYDSTAKYVYVLGDDNSGKTMFINAGTLASGASVFIPYYRSVASLVSPANIVMCPNPDYLTQRGLAYLWEGQGDARFPQAKFEADKILKRMMEFEQTYGEGYIDQVFTAERKHFNSFRWGKNS